MKTVRIVIALLAALLLMQGMVLTGAAQGPAGTWASGIQIQNESTTTANVTIEFYGAKGTAWEGPNPVHTITTQIPGRQPGQTSSATWFTPNVAGLPQGFIGSAVVSSDQPVAAIVNTRLERDATYTLDRQGSATGVLDPQPKVYTPYLRKAYFGRNSYIAVQNTETTAANVTIKYYSDQGTYIAAADQTDTIPKYTTRIFYQDANANLPAGFFGSAVVDGGSSKLAVVVNNANAGTSLDTVGFESYNALVNSNVTKLYMPKLTVNLTAADPNGYQSGVTVQNVGNADATMTLSLTYGSPAVTVQKTSPLIKPNQSWVLYLASAFPGLTNVNGSGEVTSDQPIVGLVTEVNKPRGFSIIWEAFDKGGTTYVLYPKFSRNLGGPAGNAYNGGIQVQNLGTQATQIIAVFSGCPGGDVTYNWGGQMFQPGQSAAVFATAVTGLCNNFAGSVVVTSSTVQPLAGTYTERHDNTTRGDTYVAYKGISK